MRHAMPAPGPGQSSHPTPSAIVLSMNETADQTPNGNHIRSGFLDGIVLGCAAIGLVLMRYAAFDVPLEADECNYAIIGQRLLDGGRLYVDAWDHQPPAIFAIYAAVIAVLGDSAAAFRSAAIGASLVSLVAIYCLCRKLAGRWPATWAALMFAMVSSDPGTAGEGCNREIYMNVFVLLAWWLAAIAVPPDRPARRPTTSPHPERNDQAKTENAESAFNPRLVFAAGTALGIGSTIKTVLAAHWVFLALWIVIDVARATASWKKSATSLLLLAAGPAFVWILTCTYFAATGRLSLFIDAAFYFNLSYSEADTNTLSRFFHFFSPERHPFVFRSALPLWLAALPAALLLLAASWKKHRMTIPALAMLAGSYVAVCLPGRAWPHYYYLMIPAMTITVACSFHLLETLVTLNDRLRVCVAVAAIALALATGRTEWNRYLSQPPYGITVARYNSRDFWAKGIGEKVASVTEPQDRIFVYGNDPGIYYYADRRCASRYTMVTGLRDGHSGVAQRREILMRELLEDPPRMILMETGEPVFEAMTRLLESHYGMAIGVDRHDKKGTLILAVFANKLEPVRMIDWDWDRSEVGGW